MSDMYEIDGPEALGSHLQIQACSDKAPDLSHCSVQWYRLSSEGGKRDLISGIHIYLLILSPLHFANSCGIRY